MHENEIEKRGPAPRQGRAANALPIVGIAFCILIVGGAQRAANSQNRAALPTWQPDKTLVKQLDAPTKIDGYSLQPPKNYAMQTVNAPTGMKQFAWVGAARQDGTHPSLLLGLISPPAGEAGKFPLAQLADKLLAGVKRRRTNWQQGKEEEGLINGFTFARISWIGTELTHKRKMRGFIYVARDGDTIVQFSSQDMLPTANEALPLAETSIFTFRKGT